jgi:6-phosphogluconolactonase
MTDVHILVASTVEGAAQLAAKRLVLRARAGGDLVITGGSTPRRAYEIAATADVDWSRVDLWFSDERCVPPTDERSNYRMLKESLLDRLPSPPAVHRMESVEQYAREIAGLGTFELVLLGLGPDGHIASLFPGFPTLDVIDRDVVGSEAGHEPFVDRITLTLPRLRNTRELVFLVTGADKADAVARTFGPAEEEPSGDRPGSLVWAAHENTHVFLDRAAAAKL